MLQKSSFRLYGFEDYATYVFPSPNLLTDPDYNYWQLYSSGASGTVTLLPESQCPVIITKELVKNHTELLTDAKNIYVHPACTISRSLLGTKYRKVKTPYAADIVVIPNAHSFSKVTYLLFINDKARIVVFIYYYKDANMPVQPQKGEPLYKYLKGQAITDLENEGVVGRGIINAEFVCHEQFIFFNKQNEHILDIITHTIPGDKTVYEKNVQESLSSEDTQLTLESLISLKDMLCSRDGDTVSAAWKALASLDYTKYPYCVLQLLDAVWDDNVGAFYNKATQSTIVRFMLKNFFHQRRRGSFTYNSDTISKEDYALLKPFLMYLKQFSSEREAVSYLYNKPYMYYDSEYRLTPRYKD